MDIVRTSVRFEKRGGRHQRRRPLLLMAALQALSQEGCRLQGRERWDYRCERSGLQNGTYPVGTSLRGGRFRWGREESRGASRANPPGKSSRSYVQRTERPHQTKRRRVARSLFSRTHSRECREVTSPRSSVFPLLRPKYDIV
jgi:hypothetical protein